MVLDLNTDGFVCRLCPRRCGVFRAETSEGDTAHGKPASFGFCGCGALPTVAAATLHQWEEPCISGTRGSGAVFFSSCNLKCVYCQNIEFSRSESPVRYAPEKLAELFLSLADAGAHNINLVTPTPHINTIIQTLTLCRDRLSIPVVYNTSGYELPESIKALEPFIDIYLTDFKYSSPDLARDLSGAGDYPEYAASSLSEMIRQKKNPVLDRDGMMKRGVIVRHLALPAHTDDSRDVIRRVYDITGADGALLSLMSQYTSNGNPALPKELRRKITTLEYRRLCDYAESFGFRGYFQQRASAREGFVPKTE